MALKSTTFKVTGSTQSTEKAKALVAAHKSEMTKVLSDAKELAEERKRALRSIASKALRDKASS